MSDDGEGIAPSALDDSIVYESNGRQANAYLSWCSPLRHVQERLFPDVSQFEDDNMENNWRYGTISIDISDIQLEDRWDVWSWKARGIRKRSPLVQAAMVSWVWIWLTELAELLFFHDEKITLFEVVQLLYLCLFGVLLLVFVLRALESEGRTFAPSFRAWLKKHAWLRSALKTLTCCIPQHNPDNLGNDEAVESTVNRLDLKKSKSKQLSEKIRNFYSRFYYFNVVLLWCVFGKLVLLELSHHSSFDSHFVQGIENTRRDKVVMLVITLVLMYPAVALPVLRFGGYLLLLIPFTIASLLSPFGLGDPSTGIVKSQHQLWLLIHIFVLVYFVQQKYIIESQSRRMFEHIRSVSGRTSELSKFRRTESSTVRQSSSAPSRRAEQWVVASCPEQDLQKREVMADLIDLASKHDRLSIAFDWAQSRTGTFTEPREKALWHRSNAPSQKVRAALAALNNSGQDQDADTSRLKANLTKCVDELATVIEQTRWWAAYTGQLTGCFKQHCERRDLIIVCIQGGPVTRVEEQKMDDIIRHAMEDIESRFKRTPSMEKRVFADFDSFKAAFETPPHQVHSVKNPVQIELDSPAGGGPSAAVDGAHRKTTAPGKMESRRFSLADSCESLTART
jgi:hypothetical protein